MPVVKRGSIAFHIGETPETVIRLKKNFGKDNVYERSWYVKEYDVNGKKVPVVFAASYSVNGNPSDRNRDDRRAVMNQAKSNYGMYGKHATKHLRTKDERKKEKLNREHGQRTYHECFCITKKEKLNRVCGQRNSGHRF